MKKIILIVSAGALITLGSCSNKSGGMSDAAKKNQDAMHIVNDGFTSGKTDKIDDAVAADFVDHASPNGNRDSLKAMISSMKVKDPNSKMDVKQEWANDEYGIEWIHMTGTSDGSMGMPAGPYDMTSVEIVKFKDGKAVEHWSYADMTEMMKMMAPMNPMMNKMDTTNMKTK